MERQHRSLFERRVLAPIFREEVVLAVIVLNTIALVLDGFPDIHRNYGPQLHAFDYGCMVFYVLEVIVKVWLYTWNGYWKNNWNKFDFIIVIIGVPILIDPLLNGYFEGVEIILLLRMGRFFRFFRMLRFIPNVAQIWLGVLRSLRASVGIFLVLFILNLIAAMGANWLFKELAPHHFGDPYVAFYSMFKVFTIEGWYEIPDELALQGVGEGTLLLIRCYFAFSVIIGGVLGLSLANAIFVDEMTVDNTDKLEGMVEELKDDVEAYKEEILRMQREHQKVLEEILKRSG